MFPFTKKTVTYFLWTAHSFRFQLWLQQELLENFLHFLLFINFFCRRYKGIYWIVPKRAIGAFFNQFPLLLNTLF